MKNTILVLAMMALSFTVDARPHYGGGYHTSSHGGTYSGGSGSSHKGGTYTSKSGSHNYGTHK